MKKAIVYGSSGLAGTYPEALFNNDNYKTAVIVVQKERNIKTIERYIARDRYDTKLNA